MRRIDPAADDEAPRTQLADPTRAGALAVLVMLAGSAVALLIAVRLMPESYDWVAHSTSESAAQGITNAWMARLGFLLFGLAVLLLTGVARDRWGPWGRILHGLFGVMMVSAAAFAARPWDDTLPYDSTEDLLHSIAAFVMGAAFALGVLAVMFRRPIDDITRRLFDWIAILSAPLIPIAMTIWPDAAGLLQRVMFTIAFAWYATEAFDSLRAEDVEKPAERAPPA